MGEEASFSFLIQAPLPSERPLRLDELTVGQILTAAPQSVTEITPESYKKLKDMSGIDGRFTIN